METTTKKIDWKEVKEVKDNKKDETKMDVNKQSHTLEIKKDTNCRILTGGVNYII